MKTIITSMLIIVACLAFLAGWVMGHDSATYSIVVRDNHGKQWTAKQDIDGSFVQFFNAEHRGESALCLPNQVVSAIVVIQHEHKIYVTSQSIGYTMKAEQAGIERWPWPNQDNDDPTDAEKGRK